MNGALHTLATAPRTLVLEDGSAAGSGWTAWGLRVPTWGEVPTWAWWMIGVAACGLVVIACVRLARRMLLEWRCGDDPSARMWLLMCDRLGVARAERRALIEMARAFGDVHPVCLLISPGTFGAALERLRAHGNGAANVLRDAERLARRWRVEGA